MRPLLPQQIAMMTPDEVHQYNENLKAYELDRARVRLARSNREAGHPEPAPGGKLYVQAARGLKQRSRAGILFSGGARREVTIIDGDHDSVIDRARKGEPVVSIHGAEEILADDALIVHSTASEDAALARIQAERDIALAERDAAVRELAELRAAARRNAPASKEGEPSRLRAAAAAESKGSTDFGESKAKG